MVGRERKKIAHDPVDRVGRVRDFVIYPPVYKKKEKSEEKEAVLPLQFVCRVLNLMGKKGVG